MKSAPSFPLFDKFYAKLLEGIKIKNCNSNSLISSGFLICCNPVMVHFLENSRSLKRKNKLKILLGIYGRQALKNHNLVGDWRPEGFCEDVIKGKVVNGNRAIRRIYEKHPELDDYWGSTPLSKSVRNYVRRVKSKREYLEEFQSI